MTPFPETVSDPHKDMLVIDASPDYWRVGASIAKPGRQDFCLYLFCFILFFGILVGITPQAVALLSSELRAASEKVQWRRDCPPFSWSHSTVFQKEKKTTRLLTV